MSILIRIAKGLWHCNVSLTSPPHRTASAALHYVYVSPLVIILMLQNYYSKKYGSLALRTCSLLLCLCTVHR